MSVPQLQAKARKHWEQWLPRLTARLKQEGTFAEATHGAAVRAQQEIESLMQEGFRPHEAEEVALKQFILLGPEPDAVETPEERADRAARERAYQKAPPV